MHSPNQSGVSGCQGIPTLAVSAAAKSLRLGAQTSRSISLQPGDQRFKGSEVGGLVSAEASLLSCREPPSQGLHWACRLCLS